MGLDFFAGLRLNDHLAIRIHPAIGVKMNPERCKLQIKCHFNTS
jgi:hypothetical protein